jgi:hypothetical protein
VQGEVLDGGVGLQVVAQSLRHREHPLPHRQAWDDVIGKVGGGVDPASGVAGRADAPALTGATR